MANFYASYPITGGSGVLKFPTFAAFPASAPDGTLALALDTDTLYAFNAGSSTWIVIGGGGVPLTIGVIDSQAPSANGAVIAANSLVMQSASITVPGLVNDLAQSFAGNKTFTGTIAASNLSGTNTGNVTLTAVGAAPNANGAILTGQALTLEPANTTFPGVLTAADWNTFNNKQNAFSGLNTDGVIYATSATTVSSTTVGTSGQVLTSNGAGVAPTFQSVGSGTVTSVALLDGSTAPIYTISGSPVTTSGTLTFTLNNENANLVFAGPTVGGAAQPTFRALVAADLPTLVNSYYVNLFTLNGADITNKFVTLSQAPDTGGLTQLTVVGGPMQSYGADFIVIGAQLNWSGLFLDGVLTAGDQLIVQFN